MKKLFVFLIIILFATSNKSFAQSGICGFVSQAQQLFDFSPLGQNINRPNFQLSEEILYNAFDSIEKLENVPLPIKNKVKLLKSQFLKISKPALQLANCLMQERQIYPNAFAIGISAFLDAFIGGVISSEFLFFINPDNSIEVIQYKVKGARVGASLQVGGEVSIGLVYQMDNPDNYSGVFLGLGASAELKIGVGATIYSGVPNVQIDEFASTNDFIEYLMFQAPVPLVIAVSGNIGAGAGAQFSYTYYTEVFRYNRLFENVNSIDGTMK